MLVEQVVLAVLDEQQGLTQGCPAGPSQVNLALATHMHLAISCSRLLCLLNLATESKGSPPSGPNTAADVNSIRSQQSGAACSNSDH